MSDTEQEKAERCVFATPTEHGWCNCDRICKIVICNNVERNANLTKYRDGASLHTYPPDGYNELFRRDKKPIDAPDGSAFVRSRFCCRRHCVDFETREVN